MSLRQSVAEQQANQVHQRNATIRMAREGLNALPHDAATALICDYIAAAALKKEHITKLARAANDRQWEMV
jgi:hypothetical protein